MGPNVANAGPRTRMSNVQRDDRTEMSEFPAETPLVWETEWDPEISSPSYPWGFYVVLSLLAVTVPLGAIAAYTAGRGSAAYVLFRWEVPLRLILQCSVPLVLLGAAAPVAIYGLLRHRAWSRHWIPGMVFLATVVAFGLFDSNDPMDVVQAIALSVSAPVLVFWYFYGSKRVAGYYRAWSEAVPEGDEVGLDPLPPMPPPADDGPAPALLEDVRFVARVGMAVGVWNCLGGIGAGLAASRVPDESYASHLATPSAMFIWAAVTGTWAIFSVALLRGKDWGRKGTVLSLRAVFVAEVAWVVHCLRAVPLEGTPGPILLMTAALAGAILFALVNLPLFLTIRLLTDDDVRDALLYGPDDEDDAEATGPGLAENASSSTRRAGISRQRAATARERELPALAQVGTAPLPCGRGSLAGHARPTG